MSNIFFSIGKSNGVLYFCGGFDVNDNGLKDCQYYDSVNNAWNVATASMGSVRGESALAQMGQNNFWLAGDD